MKVSTGLRGFGPRGGRRVVATAVALVVAAGSALLAAPSYAADTAKVYIVQGLPGERLDVEVDGKSVAKGLETAEVSKGVTVKAGRRTVTLTDADGDTVLKQRLRVRAGSSWDVVAHLPADEGGDPMLTVYRNDTTAVPQGRGELVVAHTARVGKADVRVDGQVLFADIGNGQSLDLTVPVRTYKVTIVPHGKTKPVVLGPAELTVQGAALNRVYAIGDPSNNTMAVAVHIIPVGTTGSDRPGRVDTGTGGQASDSPPRWPALWR